MSSDSSNVGAIALPLTAQGADTPLVDPLAFVVAHFLAHRANLDVSPKLEEMRPFSTEAIPTAPDGVPQNVGIFNPGTTFVRRELPAIYCWAAGSKLKQWTMVKFLREVELHVRWYFKPITLPPAGTAWSGIPQAVDRSFAASAVALLHSTFPPAALEMPIAMSPGQQLESALCLHKLKLVRSIVGTAWESPGQSAGGGVGVGARMGSGTDGARQTGFPMVHTVWLAEEIVTAGRATGADERPDITLAISASDGLSWTPTHIMDRTLPGPDGTDSPSQKGP